MRLEDYTQELLKSAELIRVFLGRDTGQANSNAAVDFVLRIEQMWYCKYGKKPTSTLGKED